MMICLSKDFFHNFPGVFKEEFKWLILFNSDLENLTSSDYYDIEVENSESSITELVHHIQYLIARSPMQNSENIDIFERFSNNRTERSNQY